MFGRAVVTILCLVTLGFYGAVHPVAAQQGGDTPDLTILIRGSNLTDPLREAIDAYARDRQLTVGYVITGS